MMSFKNEARGSNEGGTGLIRHMVLSTILSYKTKYGKEFGEVVIAFDSRHYWRRDVFPHYKGKRKENREKSDLDWEFIFKALDEVKRDLAENFRYKLIEVDGAEADDIIAILTKYTQDNDLVSDGLFDGEPQPVLIVSSDGDFVQLQKWSNVKQFAPMLKKWVKPKTSLKEYITEHICCAGDDGIPNICSADDCFMTGTRQTPFKKARLKEFLEHGIDACKTDTERRNYQRNQLLIDFDYIPADLQEKIVNTYKTYEVRGSRTKIMSYLMKHKMKLLLESAGDF